MKRKRTSPSPVSLDDALRHIKRLALVAIFSDDELMEKLVLKGGNALDLVYEVTSRASLDLDFSMEEAFDRSELDGIRKRLEFRLQQTFGPAGYAVLDVKLEERPEQVSSDLASFWGGYSLTFKLVAAEQLSKLGGNIPEARRRALPIGPRQRTSFEVDISKYEYCSNKSAVDIDGLTVFVYTPEMIVCEKLRAICQQMPEYTRLVRRHAAPRARDFLDIYSTIQVRQIDLCTETCRDLLDHIFAAKRVPLELLGCIKEHREFHRQDWPAVEATDLPHVLWTPG